MKIIILVVALATTVYGASTYFKAASPIKDIKNFHNSRITWGEDAQPQQFPWQVAVYAYSSNGKSLCGGSVISREWILTAGHCVYGFKSHEIVLATLNLQYPVETLPAELAIVHEEYDPTNLHNDIALIKLKNKINPNPSIKIIPIAPKKFENEPLDGKVMTVSGYGMTHEGGLASNLQYVDVKTITNKQCEDHFGPEFVVSSTLCALGATDPKQSSCNGDSGGPLIMKDEGVWKQFGIVSFGDRSGCEAGYPQGYTRVASYGQWISKHTGVTFN